MLATGRYELRERIGGGAMGLVYRAWDREAGREVAVKMLARPDPDDLFRLKHEFRSLARIAHPNLMRLYELVAEGDQCFFTMELIEGGADLVEHVAQVPEALRPAFIQLAEALATLHRANKIHRDLKPQNVLVDSSGRVVLLDFGLVGGLDSQLSHQSQVGSFVGTLAYMPPEQALGRALGPAADWYSFGVMLYEAVAGRSPFAAASPVELVDRRRLEIEPPEVHAPDCPGDLAQLAMDLLAVDADARPGDEEILAVLGADVAAPRPRLEPLRAPSRFVGRKDETAALGRAREAMARGEVAAVAIEGPSGIGKTELIRRFLESFAADSLVLRSRCYPYEVVPFEALDEAIDELSRFLVTQSPERLEALMPRNTAALRRVLPVLARVRFPERRSAAPIDADPHEVRRQAFLALRELLGRVADRQPLAIWIDDLQWGDPDSDALLRTLLRPPDPPPILWLFSFRSEESEASALLPALPALLELVPEVNRHWILLGALSEGESRELAELVAGQSALADESLRRLAEEAKGSPFLLGEMARHYRLGEMARHYRGDGVAVAGEFDSVLMERVARLPGEAQRLVETVAVAAGPLERAVAMRASGISDFDPDLISNLERERLLRTTSAEGRVALEVYHDRIRDGLEARLPMDRLRSRHGAIAKTLEERGGAEPHALFKHFNAAGHAHEAAIYGMQAGDQAAAQLAFDQAAFFYRQTLDLDPTAAEPLVTQTRLAEALANAGRGGEAAIAFGEAAEHASVSQGRRAELKLRRESAEQFLLSGRLEEGARVLRPLLESVSVGWPESPGKALRSTLLRLPQLSLQYRRFRPRDDSEIPDSARLAVDLCQTAAKGLLVVDPLSSAYFSVTGLITALRAGELRRTGRALGAVGVALVPVGGPISTWAKDMLQRSAAIGEETGDPYLIAVASTCAAEARFVEGRWSEMLAFCDRGVELLRANCRGVRWELDVANMAALRALEELGRIPELRARTHELLAEAEELEDRYALVTFSLYRAFWAIAASETRAARRIARDGLARWGNVAVHLQHLYALRIEAFCDVFEGNPESGWQRVTETWLAIRKANLLRHPILRTDAYTLRACTALALAEASSGASRKSLLEDARRSAQAIGRARRPDASGGSALLHASVAHMRGDLERALARLDDAIRWYDVAEMPLHGAYARSRRGRIVGGEEGDGEVAAADRELRRRGVESPERWLAVVAPGFTGLSP